MCEGRNLVADELAAYSQYWLANFQERLIIRRENDPNQGEQNAHSVQDAICLAILVLFMIVFGIAIIHMGMLSDEYHKNKKLIPVLKDLYEVSVGDIYQSEAFFLLNYAAMEREFKVFEYPGGDPESCFHSTHHKLKSKYASERYFFMNLRDSQFLTSDPLKAHLFFIPFSCQKIRKLDIANKEKTIENYVRSLISRYPYWNRTLGADHFFVSCHDIGSRATEEVPFLLKNAIRLVCSPSYDSNYIPRKDVSLPQILELSLPPDGDDMWNRRKLGFFAGSLNSEVRRLLRIFWKDVPEFDFHFVKIKRAVLLGAYEAKFYGSKFCICPRGETQVGGVCLAESMTFGCIPVILSDYYDLPFNDILNWNSFSLILKEDDVPNLDKILKGIPRYVFETMHQNVLQVRKHFKWNSPPVKYDEFHMVMYELWQRHHIVRY